MSENKNNAFYQNKLIYLNEKASILRTKLADNQIIAYKDKESELKKNRKRLYIMNISVFAIWVCFTALVYSLNITTSNNGTEGIGTVGIGFIHQLITSHIKADINDTKKDLDKIIMNWEFQIGNLDKSFNQEQQGLERALDISADKKVTSKKKQKKKS